MAGAAGTKTVKTRLAMSLPCLLAAHVIDQDLTAREALDLPPPIVEDLGMDGQCQPLMDWLLIASTDSGRGTSPIRLPSVGVTPQGMRPVHAERDEDILFWQLPALQPVTGTTDPAVLGILQATRDQRNAVTEDIADRRVERERERAPKTVEERWPDHCNRLLKLCHTDKPENLPSFWQRAAAWKKGSGTTMQGLLQSAVEQAAHELEVPAFQVTVRHANDVQNWNFIGPSPCHIATGLSPFTVTPPGAVLAEALV